MPDYTYQLSLVPSNEGVSDTQNVLTVNETGKARLTSVGGLRNYISANLVAPPANVPVASTSVQGIVKLVGLTSDAVEVPTSAEANRKFLKASGDQAFADLLTVTCNLGVKVNTHRLVVSNVKPNASDTDKVLWFNTDLNSLWYSAGSLFQSVQRFEQQHSTNNNASTTSRMCDTRKALGYRLYLERLTITSNYTGFVSGSNYWIAQVHQFVGSTMTLVDEVVMANGNDSAYVSINLNLDKILDGVDFLRIQFTKAGTPGSITGVATLTMRYILP